MSEGIESRLDRIAVALEALVELKASQTIGPVQYLWEPKDQEGIQDKIQKGTQIKDPAPEAETSGPLVEKAKSKPPTEGVKPRRKRRTKEQIEADVLLAKQAMADIESRREDLTGPSGLFDDVDVVAKRKHDAEVDDIYARVAIEAALAEAEDLPDPFPPTKDELISAIKSRVARSGRDATFQILQQFGAINSKTVQELDYADCIKRLEG